jgi:formate hydrogenlyase subunit 3/multisubunit Na+/H+ antiporter MnhD subunit
MSGMIGIIIPLACLVSGAFLLYVLARVFHLNNRVESLIAAAILTITLVLLILGFLETPNLMDNPNAIFGVSERGGIVFKSTALGHFVTIVGVVIGLIVTLYSGEYLSRDPRFIVYYPLILLNLSGLLGIFLSNNLFNLFLLTEFITITASGLIAFRYKDPIAIQAGYKYLIMSSVGTMMMLLGIYFVFRSTGGMDFLNVLNFPDDFTRVGAVSFLLGFSLKAGVVPLHTWVPDVYGHAPSAVSGLLAGVLSKSMLLIMPIICLRLGMTQEELGLYLMIFACFNMLIGSIRMLRQKLLRRFLSFSSIAQTGYLMFGLGIGFYYQLNRAFAAGLFLFLIVALMKSLAFLAAGIFEYHAGSQDIEKIGGIGLRMPLPALCFSIALGGLAGIPLLAGFTGKWLIFSATIATGDYLSIIGLVIFLISTVIGLGGYLPIIVKLYRSSAQSEIVRVENDNQKIHTSHWMLAPVAFLAFLVVAIGVYPGPWITLVEQVMQWMQL